MPQFSIIMPTYNRAKFISTAIESVINQTFNNWELIIIDDGSIDDTNNIVSNYLKDSRVRYFYQKNQERSVARNNGISKARGEFICFLDSDDYYLAHYLGNLNDFINTNGIIKACICSQAYLETQTGHRTILFDYKYIKNNGIYNIIFESLINSTSICVHKECLKDNLFPEKFTLFEDNHLLLRILSKFPFYFINNPSTVLLEHESRTVNSSSNSIIIKSQKYFEAVDDLINNYPWVKVTKNEWRKFKALKKLTFAFEALKIHNLTAIYIFTFESLREKIIIRKISKYCKLLFFGWLIALLKIKI